MTRKGFGARVSRFIVGQDGAITVDWVVLTAIASGFALLVVAALTGGVLDMSSDLDTTVGSVEVTALGVLGSGG